MVHMLTHNDMKTGLTISLERITIQFPHVSCRLNDYPQADQDFYISIFTQ